MTRRYAFPRKYAQRGAQQPIQGRLSSMKLEQDHKDLIDRITIGLFLDMQNKPLADILAACYMSGVQHAMSVLKEQSRG